MKNSLSNVSTLCQLAWVAIYSVPGCLLLSLVFEVNQLTAIMSAPAGAWMGLGYTVVGSSLAAYGIWYELVKRCEVSKLSAFLFLMPIVGVVIGMLVRGESLSWMKLLGTALILYAMKLSI
jgi:O-acetylserine/cysteine efflux transporter